MKEDTEEMLLKERDYIYDAYVLAVKLADKLCHKLIGIKPKSLEDLIREANSD